MFVPAIAVQDAQPAPTHLKLLHTFNISMADGVKRLQEVSEIVTFLSRAGLTCNLYVEVREFEFNRTVSARQTQEKRREYSELSF